jgi:hypothetical protein
MTSQESRRVYRPEDFGAKYDGAVDDGRAIQAAIDALVTDQEADRKLHALAATHIMGWYTDIDPDPMTPLEQRDCWASPKGMICCKRDWNPCHDIAQAWLLVEKLRERDIGLTLYWEAGQDEEAEASFNRVASLYEARHKDESPTRAIVLAALKVAGVRP